MGAFHIAGRNPAGGAADFVYKDAVMQNGDFRNREFQRAVVRYCSFFQTNMANIVISRGEDLIGNGWMDCSFFGAVGTGIRVEQDLYERCSMGNMKIEDSRLLDTVFRDCGCMGSSLERLDVKGCTFYGCNFRKVRFTHAVMKKVLFESCIFDDTVFEQVKLSEVSFRNCIFRGKRMELNGEYRFCGCSFDRE